MNPAAGSLRDAVESAPEDCGVYLFKDEGGKVLYVGKAKSLRSRLRSYLRPGGDGRIRLRFLDRQAKRVEVIVTPSEAEALLLEERLIKQHLPPHNVRLKDDKSFLMLRLDPRSPFPRLEPVRSRAKKEMGFQYFGPYPSSQALRRTLRLLQSLVPLRDCTDQVMRNRSRPCLKHQIGRCAAPCVGLIGREEYAGNVERAAEILRGKTEGLEKDLERRMRAAASELQFEKAKVLRDQLGALCQTTARRPVLTKIAVDRDVFGYHRRPTQACVTVLRFRGGSLVDSRSYPVPPGVPEEETFSGFLSRFYATKESLPQEIVLPCEVNEREMLEKWLGSRGGGVTIQVPRRGEKLHQRKMAEENARVAAVQAEQRREADAGALEALRERLGLAEAPETVDCFDISELQGAAAVASRVRFVGGRPRKAGYRRYRIRSVAGQDDFASMLEVVSRSLGRGVEEGDLPDLVVIDGGKGQLASALAARDEAGAWDVQIVALAKDREKEEEGKKFRTGERVFLPGADEPVALPPGTPELHLLQRVRDEAHRFAITYHRKKRDAIRSELDGIPGLGPKRKRELLRRFGSVQGLREAAAGEIAACPGMTRGLAQKVWQVLRET